MKSFEGRFERREPINLPPISTCCIKDCKKKATVFRFYPLNKKEKLFLCEEHAEASRKPDWKW